MNTKRLTPTGANDLAPYELCEITGFDVCNHKCNECASYDILKRLSEYEDTGYSPNDFDTLCREMSRIRQATGDRTYEELRERYAVYVVTGYGSDSDPVITVFNNEESARKYEEFAKTKYQRVCFDKAPIYGKYFVGGHE